MKKQKSPRQRAKAALKTLISEAGNRRRLAMALGTDQSTPYRWDVIPEEYLVIASIKFGRRPDELRPDLSAFQISEAVARTRELADASQST